MGGFLPFMPQVCEVCGKISLPKMYFWYNTSVSVLQGSFVKKRSDGQKKTSLPPGRTCRESKEAEKRIVKR